MKIQPLRACSRTRGEWIVLYVAPNAHHEHPEVHGKEVGRLHRQLVDEHPRGREWLVEVLQEIGRSAMVGALGAEPTEFDVRDPQEPEA